MKWMSAVKMLCQVRLFATPWTVAYQFPACFTETFQMFSEDKREIGRLQSMGSQRVEPDRASSLHSFTSYFITGEGNGNPLQYSCLENPMDRGAWWALVHVVTESWTRLMWLSTHTGSFYNLLNEEVNYGNIMWKRFKNKYLLTWR